MWKVNILTTIKSHYYNFLSIANNKNDIYQIYIYDIRDYALNKHKNIDAPPYGGGGGMLIRADIIGQAIQQVFNLDMPIIYFSPRGKKFNQKTAIKYTTNFSYINILCGRFEGIDERVIKEYSMSEISVGDYILSSGDIAALVFLDTCIRLLPNKMKNKNSLQEESFGKKHYAHLLEYPHYTKPRIWMNRKVPDVLVSGHHQNIKNWRLHKAEEKTKKLRPDLWKQYIKTIKYESITKIYKK